VTVTSRSKSLKTKTSFPKTQQYARESRSDLFLSSTSPTDPRRIVNAERFAFQLPLSFFFFLLWWVKSAFERLEVPSSSSEDSSSSSPGRLNLSILVVSDAMERVRDLIVGPFPLFFPVALSFPLWPFPTWPRLRRLSLSVFFWSGVRAWYSCFSKIQTPRDLRTS
jgi:hypothetical protein